MENIIAIAGQEELKHLKNFNILTFFNDERDPSTVVTNDISDLLKIVREHRVDGILVSSDAERVWHRHKGLLQQLKLPTYYYDKESQTIEKTEETKQNHFIARFLKRSVDIVAAVILLIVAVIVGIIIYPIVQSQSKGPLLFKQKRVGKNGRLFEFYKFRSMYLDAEERKKHLMSQNELSSDYMFKLENDPRVFPFGQKIRDWSLDELPQAWNILKGDMSLIGTRPPTQNEYESYDWHHFQRLRMKPGITGMWQVSGRSNITDFEKVVALDMQYISNWSLWLDIQILFKTLLVVIKREGSK